MNSAANPLPPPGAPPQSGPAAGHDLAMEHLSFAIGGVSIVDDVSLAVAPGEFLGVIGPNGAGKTTLFNLLSGLVRATGGVIRLSGRDVTRWPPERRARAGLGRTFQASSTFDGLTVWENVRLAAQAHQRGSHKLWRRASRLAGPAAAAGHALRQVGLDGAATTLAGALSHGDKRKLELAIL